MYRLKKVRRGKGERSCYIYAELSNAKGEVVISATLDYILKRAAERGYEVVIDNPQELAEALEVE